MLLLDGIWRLDPHRRSLPTGHGLRFAIAGAAGHVVRFLARDQGWLRGSRLSSCPSYPGGLPLASRALVVA